MSDSGTKWAWVGVDVGLDGGIAALGSDGSVQALRMPTTKRDDTKVPNVVEIRNVIWGLRFCGFRVAAAVEEPFLVRGQRGNLTIGKNWGIVLAAFHGLDTPVTSVPPKTWQDEVLAGIVDPDPKVRAAEYVRRTYPDVCLRATSKTKVDHDGIIDAICIADWIRRRTGGG